jgi:EAL domain-containing protein (putative c-di-GMP-specific phosphodiesterase class I)
MAFPVFDHYISWLPRAANADQRIWLDAKGRVQGRYFNCTLTSVFQPVRLLASGRIAGYEGFIRSSSENDPGLSLWKLLECSAGDDESIELDRLCRMLHLLNFYRQPEAAGADLYLNVHGRLLAAVGNNHGTVFRRIVDHLGLPMERIVLQLPPVTPNQGWVLNYVADNYRRNGFRIAVGATDAVDGLRLLESTRPDTIKLDAREIVDRAAVTRLLAQCDALGVALSFKRVESIKVVELLRSLRPDGWELPVQGHVWDVPGHTLATLGAHAGSAHASGARPQAEASAQAG